MDKTYCPFGRRAEHSYNYYNGAKEVLTQMLCYCLWRSIK